MTRVLVVHHDPDQADIEVDRLRREGHEVQQCAGPAAGSPLPRAAGRAMLAGGMGRPAAL